MRKHRLNDFSDNGFRDAVICNGFSQNLECMFRRLKGLLQLLCSMRITDADPVHEHAAFHHFLQKEGFQGKRRTAILFHEAQSRPAIVTRYFYPAPNLRLVDLRFGSIDLLRLTQKTGFQPR